MHNHLSKYVKRIGCKIKELEDEIRGLVAAVSPNVSVESRIKNPYILAKKMRQKNARDIFMIHDVYAVRVIVERVEHVYAVLEKISKRFHGFLDHDYIRYPKTRSDDPKLKGKALRLLQFIAYKNGAPFEMQITTSAFHEENQKLHERYHQRKYQ